MAKKKTDLSVNRRRKATSGAATSYMSRNQALKRLQLRLPDFRRLCILKGIYPHEPRHTKKAGGAVGSTLPKTYYYTKDINFLMHEPIVAKFREHKVHARKIKRALGRSERAVVERLKESKPRYDLAPIIRERFPTFIDAVRYLPDCLDTCFTYATLPASRRTPPSVIRLCRRLIIEFMLYVIASKSLRKVFVSIKGFYFEAEISGQPVLWRVPHSRAYERPSDVDFRILGTHVEFNSSVLGFVNYGLFTSIGLHYPPALASGSTDEQNADLEDRLAALTLPLKASAHIDEVEMDVFPAGGDTTVQRQQEEIEAQRKFENLFTNLRFFLQREVDREQLTFVIRSFGGEVSWDRTLGPGCTYQEDDERITHQIVDRGAQSAKQRVISRCYIQPQWVFDSVNAKRLLPPEKYFPGVQLPPHLSPFVEEREGEYVPPEKLMLTDDTSQGVEDSEDNGSEEVSDSESVGDDDVVMESVVNTTGRSESGSDDDEDDSDSNLNDKQLPVKKETAPEVKLSKRQMKKLEKNLKSLEAPEKKATTVTAGKIRRTDMNQSQQETEREERRLAEMMIPKKKQRLYRKIMTSKRKTAHEARVLSAKRQDYDKTVKKQQAKAKKIARKS